MSASFTGRLRVNAPSGIVRSTARSRTHVTCLFVNIAPVKTAGSEAPQDERGSNQTLANLNDPAPAKPPICATEPPESGPTPMALNDAGSRLAATPTAPILGLQQKHRSAKHTTCSIS